MRIARIAAVAIGAGLVVAAIEGMWPIVFFALLSLLILVLLEKL